ncbi:hypothetical protein C0033_12935 [Clostridium sp. chh4-2]|uniref:glycosyl hydrolase n=1 Tax=Clostridium sp. chh4-2 TaxID=2067550 RepID=UPI000CCF429C|nr:glycosyl hydrolase [Clostridium sp. chh4-2]PNV61484.1 hypothetical protein C0033_12935 [Clostridium sp. chh4-2]
MNNRELKLGMQPFWFWNGEIENEELVRQILEMKQKGIPGFMIHPRQGMEIPYMSKLYFDKVRLAVETARDNDMEVWIYDEYPYPSGICGGEVILDHPEYLCKRLKRVVQVVEGGQEIKLFAPWGKVILARAYRIKGGGFSLDDYVDIGQYVGTGYQQEIFQYSGLTKYNKKRYFTGDLGKLLCWTPPKGTWKIYFVTEVVLDHFKYFENFIDTMNPDAVKYFIKLSHERYKQAVGDEFGKTIKGFFTDEVTAFPDKEPWSVNLPGKIMERYGIDLISCLPALWEDMGEISSKVRFAYWNTATDCFIESYDKQVYDWCENNHLLYIGEKPIMRSRELKYVHIPGIDAGHQKVGSPAKIVSERYRSNGKMISSAAHFYDKPAALCEAGHSIGWGMTMQDLKWIFDWLAVQGVDFYVIHGFFYTTDGLKKHDAPPSAFFQMPWWEDASCLIKYAAGLSDFLQSLKKEIKILVIDPVTSCWTSSKEEQVLLKEDFAAMQNQMLCQELDYYIIDPELLASGGVRVNQGKTELFVHDEGYEILVLPPMRNLEADACKKIVEFASKGGKICSLSGIPFEKIEDSDKIKELETLFELNGQEIWRSYINRDLKQSKSTGTVFYAAELEDLITWLKKACPSRWQIRPLDSLKRKGLPSIYGTDKTGRDVLFLVNTSPNERNMEIRDPDGKVRIITLSPYESKIITTEKPKEPNLLTVSLEDNMEFSINNFNALRLSAWTAALPDGQERITEAAPIIDQLETAGFLRPVCQKKYFGCPKELEFEKTQVRYYTEFCVSSILKQKNIPIYLVMEPGTFLGDWQIQINGHVLEKEKFTRKHIYLNTNLAADVKDLICAGENKIEVTVQTDVSYGGMRNPIYLFGDFQVYARDQKWTLFPPVKKGGMKDMKELGLPFYYGEIIFTTHISLSPQNHNASAIKLDAPWLTDSVRLRIGGYETEPCAWQPYIFKIPDIINKKAKVPLDIIIKTSAAALFEGQRFNQKNHEYENIPSN